MSKIMEMSMDRFIDGLLDRISSYGVETLSEKEKRFLDSLSGEPDRELMNELVIDNFPVVTNLPYSFRLTGLPEITGAGYYIPGILTCPSPLDEGNVIEVSGGIIENPSEGTHIYDYFWSGEQEDDVEFDIGDLMEDHEEEFVEFTDLLVDQISWYFWDH